MVFAILEVVLGLVGLLLGGEFLVRGAVRLAQHYKLSRMVIGLSVVAFGTSSPELVVCVLAALQDRPSLALGNVVGSNIANILLIFGAMALLCPVIANRRETLRDGSVLLLVSFLMYIIALTGEFTRPVGLMMLIGLGLYLMLAYRTGRVDPDTVEYLDEVEVADAASPNVLKSAGMTVVGVIGLCLGSHYLLEGAVFIARAAEVSELVIGVTLVAVGTSLPELATVLVAAWRKHADVALGNIVGSNIFNVLGILGITAMVRPIPVPTGTADWEFQVMLGVSVLLVGLLYAMGRMGRAAGSLFLATYALFIADQFGIGLGALAAGP